MTFFSRKGGENYATGNEYNQNKHSHSQTGQ